jgi:outer membrane lipoprotein-sorting protein
VQLLMALPLFLVGQTDAQEAERLFQAMASKVVAAKGLKIVCKTSVEHGSNVYRVDVTLYAASDNRLRVHAVGALKSKKDEELLAIANGKKLAVAPMGKGEFTTREVPADYKDKLLDLLVRTAVGTALDELVRPGTQPTAEELTLSNFKLGAREKVDGKREARVVEYELGLKQKGGGLKVKLWIDTQTMLPVYRVMTITAGTTESRFTEVFSEFAVEPAVDAKLFELPAVKAGGLP